MITQISWSSLQRWEKCHHHQKLSWEHRTIRSGAQGRIFLDGTVADRAMRRVLESNNYERGDMAEHVDDLIRAHAYGEEAEGPIHWRGPNDRAIMANRLREGLTLLEPLLEKYVLPFPYHPEWRFTAYIQIPYLDGAPTTIKMVGGADVLVKPGRFHLHDLKFTADANYWKKTLGQLTFYDIGIEAVLGEPPEAHAFLQPLVESEPYKLVTVTDRQRAEMMARIIAFCRGIWLKDFAPKEDNDGCSKCDAVHACEKFRLDISTMANGRKTVSFRR